MDDLVSIVMPAYNNARYVGATIRSVLAQTYRNWELLFVDDCSTDGTGDIAGSFADPRIRIFRNEKNSGAALSRNRALREAKGKWVAFLDGDDWWHPEKLERQLEFMKRGGYAFSCTDYRIQLNGVWQNEVWTGPAVQDKKKMYKYNYFSTITVIYDRERIGLLQIADLRKRNDYLLWLHAIEKAPCHRLPQCLSFYIKHDGSLTTGISKWKLMQWHYILFRKGLGMNPVASAFLGARNIFYGIRKRLTCGRPVNEDDERLTRETEQVAAGL